MSETRPVRNVRRTTLSSRGATLIEIALVIPMFLAVILVMLWIATMLNARASLVSAMSQGIHLAIARAHDETLGAPLLKGIRDFHTSSTTSAAAAVLCSNSGGDGRCFTTYDECTVEPAFTRGVATLTYTVQHLPEEYLYALVYINEAMRQSLGNMVRFPCPPQPVGDHCPGYTGTISGPGCFLCHFGSPLERKPNTLPPPAPATVVDVVELPILSTDTYTSNGIAYSKEGYVGATIFISCEYEPDVSIAKPIHALLGWAYPRGNVMSWETAYTVSSLADSKTFF